MSCSEHMGPATRSFENLRFFYLLTFVDESHFSSGSYNTLPGHFLDLYVFLAFQYFHRSYRSYITYQNY